MRTPLRVIALLCLALPVLLAATPEADAETRTLKLYYIHTKERAEITFKKNGRYVQSGLNKLNRFLRDWRKNEPTKMDPQLFDIVWEAYQMTGARDYIHVVSAYRSPATNAMLRRTRGGQAKKSQHMYGRALDFYIPGVKLSKLREVGFKLQGGGVGYYPKSGSPFVHFDTGNVRAWPRMSRAELTRIFPKGGTLHLPPDGKPLPGYNQALAAYEARKKKGQATAIAYNGGGNRNSGGGGGLLANLFGGGADEEEDNIEAASPAPRPTTIVRNTPEPDTKSPGALIAALAPRKTPLPQFAPRPQGIIPLAQQPQETAVAAAPADEPATVAVPGVPLPQAKPQREAEVQLASADPDRLASRRSATEIEAALRQRMGMAAAPAAPEEEASVETLIASVSDRSGPAREALRVPLPTAAPRPQAETEEQAPVAVASLPAPVLREDVVSDARIATAAAYSAPAPGPRPVREDREPVQVAALPATSDQRVTVEYNTGVSTTAKSARPTMTTASTPSARIPSEVVPAAEINPARFGSWTTSQMSVTDDGRAAERPVFIQNALREAPTSVYTEGFRKNTAPDPRRFSGNAVTFLTVEKFAGGTGGDGQPLTLRLPVTN